MSTMQTKNLPALYRSADGLSNRSQKTFLAVLALHLFVLIVAAAFSVIGNSTFCTALAQLIALAIALSCSIFLATTRPDRNWYAGRAVAESVKTITWRYVSKAEPFDGLDAVADAEFRNSLKMIVDQNKDISQRMTEYLTEAQITDEMRNMRAQALETRRSTYARDRIGNQLSWYAKKANFNKRRANQLFCVLIAINAIAVFLGVIRFKYLGAPYWPTDIFVATAASLLSWMQARRFSELGASYALAAHEISLIKERAHLPETNDTFSLFVGDAENAFSREHTQWAARKDQ